MLVDESTGRPPTLRGASSFVTNSGVLGGFGLEHRARVCGLQRASSLVKVMADVSTPLATPVGLDPLVTPVSQTPMGAGVSGANDQAVTRSQKRKRDEKDALKVSVDSPFCASPD